MQRIKVALALVLGVVGNVLSAQSSSDSDIYFVHSDHLGTPQVLTDNDQNVVWRANYTPFGEADIVVEQVEMPLRFPGQYYDKETGYHYNYFRTYDPSTGRYLQSDPIGLNGGLNTYGYVLGNPLKYIDPFGLDTWWVNRGIGGSSATASPVSHSFIAVTGANGKVTDTYSWGNNFDSDGKTAWVSNAPEDMKAAQEAVDKGLADKIGGSLLDPYIKDAFKELKKQPPGYWLPWDNCKHRAVDMLDMATQNQIADACGCP